MSGIFISYRRIDTEPWAGRLFDELKRKFGASQVFMDIKGGIPRGADFEQVLTQALAGCDVLLALIGPEWLACTRSDGTRRLDIPDDWVRKEIASALQRKIPVMPVMLGGARRPEKAELPDDLCALPVHETAEIREESFNYDFGELVRDLRRWVLIPDAAELHHPETGIVLFRKLISEMPAAVEQMSRSAHAAEVARKEVKELELYKAVHDLLHRIEFEIQRPIQETGPNGARLRQFRHKFIGIRREILTQIEGHELPGISTALVEQLQSTMDIFMNVGDTLIQDAYDALLYELDTLLVFGRDLDVDISMAQKHIDLDVIATGMARIHELIRAGYLAHDPDLKSAIADFTRSVQALKDMQQELERRVREHRQFQELDSLLRMICKGGASDLARQWKRVKQARSKLVQPLPPAWQDISTDMDSTESNIEDAILEGNNAVVRDLLVQYFSDVSTVFYHVDADLKAFVGRLKCINPVLDALLSTSENGGANE